ncbi:hypothetical protein I4U23_002323 [Adineta vaga]|nr:hypothetical protein I4U23_002323 [Adineta vaga]
MPSKTHHNSMQSSSHSKDHRHHHRSTRSATLLSHNGSSQFSNDNNYHRRSISPPSPISMHYSAYFISRVDLDDYTEHTLKQTVDNVVSVNKIRGLKVKLIFPDEGLIVDNIIDPNQSWMYKASELLYFWRDPYYMNIVVAVTSNRLRPTANGPYSASIFRLRGDGLLQIFFQRAQQFFGQYVPPPVQSTNSSKVLIEKSTTVDNLPPDNQKKKSKHHSMTNKQSTTTKSARSLQTTPVRQGARTEFDPARTKSKQRNSIFNLYNNRTNSESTLLNDSRSKSSRRRSNNYDADDKVTSISVHLSGEHVAELMRELKELRNEIASLKLEARFTPVRSTSTSPMTLCPENALNNNSLSTSLPALVSQTGNDGEKATASNSSNNRQQLNDVSIVTKRKTEQSNTLVNKRPSSTSSNNNESDKEEPVLVNFADASTSIDAINSANRDDKTSATFPLRPRPIKSYPHSFSNLTNATYNLLPTNTPSKLALTDDESSSVTIPITRSSLSVKPGDVVSFRSAVENTNTPPDHTYENIPISSQNEPTKLVPDVSSSPNENDLQSHKSDIYVNATVERDLDSQQTSDAQRGSTLINTHEPTLLSYSPSSLIKDTLPSQTLEPQIIGSPRPQPAIFANRLTNPAFSVDRQLLANTIANQFDLHLNSPYLQKLIENQHLFVSQKRTYANMIWQMTPDEETAICTSPAKTIPNVVDSTRLDSTNSTAKSILKQHKHRTVQKKQRITWDSKLE